MRARLKAVLQGLVLAGMALGLPAGCIHPSQHEWSGQIQPGADC